MDDANEALANVRGWLCDNLSDGDAGEVCGMLSTVSRHINRLENENAKLRELVCDLWEDILAFDDTPYYVARPSKNPAVMHLDEDWAWKHERMKRMRELGIEVD